MTNYTKGEWKAFKHGMGDMVISTNDKEIAKVLTFNCALDGWESQSNAQLIAAAVNACISVNLNNPQAVAESIKEMYEALKTAKYEIERLAMVTGYEGEAHYSKLELIKQALFKAEGK